MAMQGHVAAITSPIDWMKTGFKAVGNRTLGLGSIVTFYVFVMSMLSALPYVGLIATALFMPFGTVLVMKATEEAFNDEDPRYGILKTLFANSEIRTPLIRTGLVYGGFLLAAQFGYTMLAVDSMQQWQIADNRLVWDSVWANFPYAGVIVAVLLYLLGQMVTWFAPALIVFKKQALTKALFYSFFGCLRNFGALLVLTVLLGLLTAGAGLACTFVINTFGLADFSMFIIIPVALAITTVSYSTLWPMWETIYGDVSVDGSQPHQ